MEIWNTINGYPEYLISNLGNVKSLKANKERILKFGTNNYGYNYVAINNTGKFKVFTIHKLVADSFLVKDKTISNLVVNHINHIRNDNRLENLEYISQRENSNKKHLKSKSKYVGVTWCVKANKWKAMIQIKRKNTHIGLYVNEIDAHYAYQKELAIINNYN